MIISESELKKIRHIFSEMIPTFFHPFTCKGPKGLPSREETCKSLVIYKSLHGYLRIVFFTSGSLYIQGGEG